MQPKPDRIYLDNAATSWPKPPEVVAAMVRAVVERGAPAGRSAYAEAAMVAREIEATRRALVELIGGTQPDQVVFTLNGTDALNIAIHGTLRPGDHVITSVVEHNSVLRPLRTLSDAGWISVTYVDCDARGYVDPDDFRRAIIPSTRLMILNHASNVTGAIQPVREIGALAAQHGILSLVDAAQTVGEVPVDWLAKVADLVAAPGHKGLLGPLGTGFLYVKPGVEMMLAPLRQGGTGSQSESETQPAGMPDRYESGNLNVPGILGLRAGIDYLTARTIDAITVQTHQAATRLLEGLAEIADVRVFGPDAQSPRLGLVSFNIEGYDPQEVAAMLDAAYRIQVRAGLHCAPRVHAAMGTLACGGTVRISLGCMNTMAEVDRVLAAVAELAAAKN